MSELLKKLDLDYFTEWGGNSWKDLIRISLNEFEDKDSLKDLSLLDIGARYGKMSVMFSLLGAKVTGIDINEDTLRIANEEAKKWNINNIKFMTYDGDLNIFPDESFDIIFTKSVLVLIPDLEGFLRQISKKLKPNGKIIFLENAKGNFLFHLLRTIRHRNWEKWRSANYFSENEVKIIQSIFNINILKKTFFPPIYLFVGQKK